MAKKVAQTKCDKELFERKSSEPRAIHYYTAPDGSRVEEIFRHPKPKKLSKAGKWMNAHPNGYEGEVYINWDAILK
jgi:hypothetical protein